MAFVWRRGKYVRADRISTPARELVAHNSPFRDVEAVDSGGSATPPPGPLNGDGRYAVQESYSRYVREAGGDGHLAIVLAVLGKIPTPAGRVEWLLARLPDSAAYFGIDLELIGRSA